VNTQLLQADAHGLETAAMLLRSGAVVAIPTETVYGLAALERSTAKLLEAKSRSQEKRVSWLISGVEWLERQLDFPPEARELLNAHDTVVLPLTGGGTQAFRVPANAFALELLRVLDVPLACTSANLSGEPPLTDAQSVFGLFDCKIAAVVDGGVCAVGKASRVVDFSVFPPQVLRG
jgi:L-threonylcarbamoyladenylate synthase